MKKTASMILSSLLVLSLAACSGGQTQESAAPSSQAETAASFQAGAPLFDSKPGACYT